MGIRITLLILLTIHSPGPILPGLTFISHLGLGFYPPVMGDQAGILWDMKVTL